MVDKIDISSVEGRPVPDWALDSTLERVINAVHSGTMYAQASDTRTKKSRLSAQRSEDID